MRTFHRLAVLATSLGLLGTRARAQTPGKAPAPRAKPAADARHELRRAVEAASARALDAYRRKDIDTFLQCPDPAAPRLRTFRGDTVTCGQIREQVAARMARARQVGDIQVRVDSVVVTGDTGVVHNTQRFTRSVPGVDGVAQEVTSTVRHRETWVRTPAGWEARFIEEVTAPAVFVNGRPQGRPRP